MPIIHYAKLNVNSHIYDVYDKKISLEDILSSLYVKISDTFDYEKIITKTVEIDGEQRTINQVEIYNFAEIDKFVDGHAKRITGKLVRRIPIHSEEFDDVTRTVKEVVYENNSVSTLFYFDLEKEIVTFIERQKLGYNQFLEAFKMLINKMDNTIGYEVFFLKDPFSIQERLESAYKINRIKSVTIPPNVNERHLKRLYDLDLKRMKEGNIAKKTLEIEVNEKSNEGINKNSNEVARIVRLNDAFDKYAPGYGKLEIDGENSDGTPFKYDSEKDSTYKTHIMDNDKRSLLKFIDLSKKGISIFLAKITMKKFESDTDEKSSVVIKEEDHLEYD